MKELIVKASLLEEGLVDEVKELIKDNEELFRDETVVLMADAHKGKDIPVGFTMTLSKGLVPPSFVSADIGCGMSSILIKDYIPSKTVLYKFTEVARDIISVNRKLKGNTLTDLGTLGNGNHFVEIGTNGKDTLITVHSGSRSFGGETYKKHMVEAERQHKSRMFKISKEDLESIEPRLREDYIKNQKEQHKNPTIPYIDLNIYGFKKYKDELKKAIEYAQENRTKILDDILTVLKNFNLNLKYGQCMFYESIHNYIEFKEDNTMILRKGSINADSGTKVVIPINMRDGIILGTSKNTENVNFSLPHGGGRVMSRTRAFNELDLETFKKDMEGVFSPSINQNTLDESPRAYKDIDTILKDITPYLEEYQIFKPLFNFKGE